MSNIIPIVSSSPPPFDDDDGWDDDDDDFGNFASAPNAPSKEDDRDYFNQNDSFEVNWACTDAFQNAEESSGSRSIQSVTKSPLNGVADETQDQVEISSLDGTEMHQKDKQLHKAPNTVLDDICQSSIEENANFHAGLHKNSFSDIPKSDVDTASISESHIKSEPEVSKVVAEGVTGVPNSEENGTFSTSKISESIVSNTSTTDSGVFSSDLSPSSYPENPSALQDNCDNTVSPKSHSSHTAEISDDLFNGISSSESHKTHSQETQDPSQNEAQHLQGSSSDINCDKGEDVGDWGDFNDGVANSNDFFDSENVAFPAFDDNAHSVCTAGNSEFVKLEENPPNVLEVDNIVQNGCDIPSSNLSEGGNSEPSHNISNNPCCFNDIDADTSKREDRKGTAENEMKVGCEVESSVNSQAEEGNCGRKLSSEKDQKCTGNFQDVSPEDMCDAAQPSVAIDEEFSVFEQFEQVEAKCDHPSEEKSSGEETAELESAVNSSIQVDGESEHRKIDRLEGEKLNSLDAEEDKEVNFYVTKSVQENVSAGVLKDTKEDAELHDTEFGSFEKKRNDLSDEVTPITFRTSVCEDDAVDGNEEDSSKERPPPFDDRDDDDDDDFADFGDFNSTSAAVLSEDADDFGDFDSGMKDKQVAPLRIVDNDDDFGDFGDASASVDQDAGWADFGGSAPAFETQPVTLNSKDFTTDIPVAAVTRTGQNKNKIILALEKCFPVGLDNLPATTVSESQLGMEQEDTDLPTPDPGESELLPQDEITALDVVIELGLANIQEAKQQTWTVVQHPAKKDPRVRVWGQMKDVDASHALGYAWPTSHCSQEIFSTLHIDTQNILFTQKKQAVPFFASGLGILEPTRGGNSATETKKEKASGLGTPLQPALLDTTASSKQPPGPPVQDIPPVDFDWSVSGLTNPLTANTLDLDFLVVQGSDSCEKTAVFKSDAESGASSQPGLQPLEEMLKKSTPTAKLATQEVVSPEAQRILTKMPDLSFMQSKVLMFPVKQ